MEDGSPWSRVESMRFPQESTSVSPIPSPRRKPPPKRRQTARQAQRLNPNGTRWLRILCGHLLRRPARPTHARVRRWPRSLTCRIGLARRTTCTSSVQLETSRGLSNCCVMPVTPCSHRNPYPLIANRCARLECVDDRIPTTIRRLLVYRRGRTENRAGRPDIIRALVLIHRMVRT